MATDRAKNTLKSARILRLNAAGATLSDAVGRSDPDDLYRVKLNRRSTLNLSLPGRPKVGLQLLGLKNNLQKTLRAIGRIDYEDLSRSQIRKNFRIAARGSSQQSIRKILEAGTYYLRVFPTAGQQNNRYRLRYAASIEGSPSPNPNPNPGPSPSPNPNPNPGPSPNPSPNPNPSPIPSPVPFLRQNWIRQFGSSDNDYSFGTAVDSAGNVYLGGVTTPGGATSGNGLIAKYSSSGTKLWERSLQISGSTTVADVEVDASGNYYVVGARINGLNSDGFVARYNSAGQQIWLEEITSGSLFGFSGADAASSITFDGIHLYVTGVRGGFPSPVSQGKAFVAKYTLNGDLVTGFGNGGIAEFGSLKTTAASGIAVSGEQVYITGITDASLSLSSNNDADLSGGDSFVASLNRSTGNVLWNQTLSSGRNTDYGRGIVVSGSDLYVVGQTAGALPSGSLPANSFAGENDAFVAKYTIGGSLEWVKQFGGSGEDAAQAIAVDPTGKIYLTGETNTSLFGTSAGGSDAWAAQIDSSGNWVSTTQIGTPQDDETYGIQFDATGALYLSGQTQGSFANAGSTNQGNYDIWLAQYLP